MPFASKGIKILFLCTSHHLSLSNHPEPCCLPLYFSIGAGIKVVLWIKGLKGKLGFALLNDRSAIPSRDVRYLWLKEEVLCLSRHYQLLSWAKPWFPKKAALLTWRWFWKFHFSWKCSKTVLVSLVCWKPTLQIWQEISLAQLPLIYCLWAQSPARLLG